MSFQAYLDAIEDKTGHTPAALVAMAHGRGYGADTKAGEIVTWLAEDFGLGKGHAMALVQVVKKGAVISDEHVGTDGVHRDASTELYLDGKANRHLHEPDAGGATG